MSLALLLLALVPRVSVQDDDAPRHVEALPREAAIVLAVHDVQQLLDNGRESAWFRFLQDDAFARVRELAAENFEWNDELPTLPELAAAIDGIGLALVGSDGEPVNGLIVTVSPGEDVAVLQELFDSLLESLDDDGSSGVDEYAGIELFRFESDSADEPTGDFFEDADAAVLLETDGLFAFFLGLDPEAALILAQDAIDRVAGEGPATWLGRDEYLEARRGNRGDVHFEAFADIPHFARFIPAPAAPDADWVNRFLDSVNSVPWVYGSARLGRGEDFELRFETRFGPETLLGRISGLARPAPVHLLSLVPAESITVSLTGFDVDGAIDLVLETFEELAPGPFEAFEASRKQFGQQLDLDPLEDLFGAFTGEFATYQLPAFDLPADPSERDLEGATMSSAILGLEDGDSFAESFERALETFGLMTLLDPDDFQGYDVYDLAPVIGSTFQMTITEDFFAFGPGQEGVHQVLRNLGVEGAPSVLDNPRMAEALDGVAGCSHYAVTDTPGILEWLGHFVMLGASAAQGELEDIKDLREFLGPEGPFSSRVVRRYFRGTLVTATEVSERRLNIRMTGR